MVPYYRFSPRVLCTGFSPRRIGALPDTLWLAPSVLLHLESVLWFQPIYCQMLGVSQPLGLRDKRERHLTPYIDQEMRPLLLLRSLSCPHFLSQPPAGCHVHHASVNLGNGKGWAPFPGTCLDLWSHRHPVRPSWLLPMQVNKKNLLLL